MMAKACTYEDLGEVHVVGGSDLVIGTLLPSAQFVEQ